MITHVMLSERLSKKMQVVLYLARKSTRMATYDELVDYFVNEKGWTRPLLNAYLSELARKRVIRRAWIKVGGRRHRVYRLNEGGSP
jgi:hypothetical protein